MPGRRLRSAAEFAGTFAITLLALWLLSGQGLGNLDDYLRNSYEIVSGYSARWARRPARSTGTGSPPWS